MRREGPALGEDAAVVQPEEAWVAVLRKGPLGLLCAPGRLTPFYTHSICLRLVGPCFFLQRCKSPVTLDLFPITGQRQLWEREDLGHSSHSKPLWSPSVLLICPGVWVLLKEYVPASACCESLGRGRGRHPQSACRPTSGSQGQRRWLFKINGIIMKSA